MVAGRDKGELIRAAGTRLERRAGPAVGRGERVSLRQPFLSRPPRGPRARLPQWQDANAGLLRHAISRPSADDRQVARLRSRPHTILLPIWRPTRLGPICREGQAKADFRSFTRAMSRVGKTATTSRFRLGNRASQTRFATMRWRGRASLAPSRLHSHQHTFGEPVCHWQATSASGRANGPAARADFACPCHTAMANDARRRGNRYNRSCR